MPGGPVEVGAKVICHDVAANYRHFPYPLDHLSGSLVLKKNRLTVDVQTISVGGRPLSMKGTIDNPGPDAVVKLDITAESVPIDETLLRGAQTRRAEGRRPVQAERHRQGPCRRSPRADGRPARGPHRHRRRDRPERAVRDHLGRSCRTPSAT